MKFSDIVKWLVENFSNILAMVITLVLFGGIYFGYQAYRDVPQWIEQRVANAVRHEIPIQLDPVTKKIEVQGRQLDAMGTYLSNVQYIENPGFFENLFSRDARSRQKYYDSIMALIPKTVNGAFQQYGYKPSEIGVTNVVIDSLLIEVRVGNSVKFARGMLTYNVEEGKDPYYKLELYKDVIEITEVRSAPQDDGTLISTVTAKSKLTGQQYSATSAKYEVDWGVKQWDWSPYGVLGLGAGLAKDGKTGMTGGVGLDWIQYHGRTLQWDVLQFRINPDAMSIQTQLKYKLF